MPEVCNWQVCVNKMHSVSRWISSTSKQLQTSARSADWIFNLFKTFDRSAHVFVRLRSYFYHVEWKKQASDCSGRLDELTRFVHSAWSWRHCRNTIPEFYLLAFYWLAIFTCSLRSLGNDVIKNFDGFEKRRQGSLSPYYMGLCMYSAVSGYQT